MLRWVQSCTESSEDAWSWAIRIRFWRSTTKALEGMASIISRKFYDFENSGNVIKELVEGYGVRVDSTKFHLGDETISSKELWTAEYQV